MKLLSGVFKVTGLFILGFVACLVCMESPIFVSKIRPLESKACAKANSIIVFLEGELSKCYRSERDILADLNYCMEESEKLQEGSVNE